jgi:hypothetical protein
MYFGGIPDETAILDRPGQLSTVDFVGCIKSISINGNEKNLIKESLNRTGNIYKKLLINSYFNLARQ